MDTWGMIRTERVLVADALAALSDADWDKPSLLPGWRVRDVVGHMIATASMTPPKFFVKLARERFRFHAMSARELRETTAGRSNSELVNLYRSKIDARTAPPGPTVSWLGETVVHSEDIFRALDGYLDHPIDHVLATANFYRGSNLLIGAKRRITGVTLEATDADWRHGTGPVVRGPAIALVLAMTGRQRALDDLSGDGVAVLRGRT